jgi:hypothetical protein
MHASVGDASRFDERSHLPPRRHTAPWPERLIEPGSAFLLDLTNAVDHIQDIEQLWRDGHLPVGASLTLFFRLSMTMTRSDRSMLLAVRASASDIRQPV